MMPLCAAALAIGLIGSGGAIWEDAGIAEPAKAGAIGAQEGQEGQEGKIDYSKKWDEVVTVPDDVDTIAEKSLPYIPPTVLQDLAPDDDQYGMRSFSVNVQPGQTLRATVHANPVGRYFINFSIPKDAEGPLFSELRSARTVQANLRRPFIELKNTTDAPFPMRFFLIGPEENNYAIKLERENAEK